MPGAGFAPARHSKTLLTAQYHFRTFCSPNSPVRSQNQNAFTVPACATYNRITAHTLTPQCDTLLLVSLAYAVITVTIHVVAGVAIVKVDVGGAVRVVAGAKLWQIARVTGLTARRARWLQLRRNQRYNDWKTILESYSTNFSRRCCIKLISDIKTTVEKFCDTINGCK